MAIGISKVLAKYLKGCILDLGECYISLSNIFCFSGTYTEGPKTNFCVCVLRE